LNIVPGFLAFNQDNQDTSDITIPASDMAPSKYRELVGILGPLGAAGIQVTAVLDSEGNCLSRKYLILNITRTIYFHIWKSNQI
jgi:hypothetical protein